MTFVPLMLSAKHISISDRRRDIKHDSGAQRQPSLVIKVALIAFAILILGAAVFAYLGRIAAVPAGNGWAVVVTDRWTGKVYLCSGNQCTQTYPPGPTTVFVGTSN
jgi:hypothetical protein